MMMNANVMIVTFLNFREFENVVKENKVQSRYFNAGFGLGRNVSHITQINGKIYAKLSPIADPIYAHTSKEVKDDRVRKQIERLLNKEV